MYILGDIGVHTSYMYIYIYNLYIYIYIILAGVEERTDIYIINQLVPEVDMSQSQSSGNLIGVVAKSLRQKDKDPWKNELKNVAPIVRLQEGLLTCGGFEEWTARRKLREQLFSRHLAPIARHWHL